jgi:hypothetical protein
MKSFLLLLPIVFAFACNPDIPQKDYASLKIFFKEWRDFETPPLLNGAPDYTKATFTRRMKDFARLKKSLHLFDTSRWQVAQINDWKIIHAEMNGFDFNFRILKPWERDPAFYKLLWTERSDVPAHEGPTPHFTTELWQYHFPLNALERKKFIENINRIPPFCQQAKLNLTGNARDLWIAGIRDIKGQAADLKNILDLPGVADDNPLVLAINKAIDATLSLEKWLVAEAVKKDGPSGIGKDNYTWYLQQVHLVPLTWDDEVLLLKRELARAWSSLKLEELRNRNLPPLVPAATPEEYDKRADEAAKSLMSFLKEADILTVKDYFEPALREHPGKYVPENNRNFFWITAHLDQRPLFSHFYHWFELAQMDLEPHTNPIRRDALLYNLFDSRNEGIATAVEEMYMQAGLYDDQPRVREIVYIMLAQRAARGLGSLYAHANLMSMEEAGGIHTAYTPRGWMKTEKDLRIFEQQLYLRQPGYGTSYITGKYLVEQAMAEYAQKLEANGIPFSMKMFLDHLNSIGNIPMDLSRQEIIATVGKK